MITRTKLYFSDSDPQTVETAEVQAIELLYARGISGATVYHTSGVWKGEREHGFVLESIEEGDVSLQGRFTVVANILRKTFDQESVLVTVEVADGDMLFIDGEENK